MPKFDWSRGFFAFHVLRPDKPRPERYETCRDSREGVEIAACTGPLEVLAGSRVLLLADIENLSISAKRLNRMLCYESLKVRAAAPAQSVECHAFFSRKPGDARLEVAFTAIGWKTHVRDVATTRTANGAKRLANADNILCFGAGRLLAWGEHDVVVLATGDGALGCDIAECVRRDASTRLRVVTASLAGSTSHRLNAAVNAHIDANLEIGEDCLQPSYRGHLEGFWSDPVSMGPLCHAPAC